MKKRIFDTMIDADRAATRRPYIKHFDLRMFDEDDGDKGGNEDGNDEGDGDDEGDGGGRMFAQADIDKAVSAALKRERTKAEKRAKEAASPFFRTGLAKEATRSPEISWISGLIFILCKTNAPVGALPEWLQVTP